MDKQPLITNDAVILGMLLSILALIFITSSSKSKFWTRFYKVIPSILLCYFIPALLNTAGIVSGEKSQLYPVASRYFLPACLGLFMMSVDFPSLKRLGGKAVVMFLTGSVGVMIGAPLALWIVASFFPGVLMYNNEEVWRGLSTIAGSWIGGGANQAAMLEIFGASKPLFGQMIAVDVLISNIWMGLLLYAAQKNEKINRWLRADSSDISALESKMEAVNLGRNQERTTARQLIILLGFGFGITGLSHFAADIIAPFFTTHFPGSAKYSLTSGFFWIVVIATAIGIALSFTKARKLENYGASEVATVFLYFLIAAIGMNMNLLALLDSPILFLIGAIWISFHILFMIIVARLIKAPFFYIAVGSQANIGGPASAPIVAAAFNKYLAPVGVMLAVLGYAVGTYAAYVTGLLMQMVHESFK